MCLNGTKTTLAFFPPYGRKGYMDLRGVGGKVSITQTPIMCETILSVVLGVNRGFIFGSDFMF